VPNTTGRAFTPAGTVRFFEPKAVEKEGPDNEFKKLVQT
jgi:hypothetical protein